MVDTSAKIDVIVRDYIERGRYFVINRARQYGKTTTLELLQSRLTDRFRIVSVSFEGAEDIFATTKSMARGISLLLMDALYPQEIEFLSAKIDEELPLRDLGKRITELCEDNVKPVILMIDEVDKTANYDVFASLLGLLRRKYLDREAQGMRSTFHSVILAGVHDIKNLKAKIHQDSEHSYNSPWNIAADFSVDMSFSANEIEGMLCGYEAERHTGMEAAALAKTIREQTSGYPYLVSALCKRLDEVTHDWTVSGLHAAVAHMMSTTNTLFDDIVKNLQRHAEFRSVVEDILLNGERVNYVPSKDRKSVV
jgi:hypothetical protein